MDNQQKSKLNEIITLLILTTAILSGAIFTLNKLDSNNKKVKLPKNDDVKKITSETEDSLGKEDVFISEDEVDYQKLAANYEKSSPSQSLEDQIYDTEKYYIVYKNGLPKLYYLKKPNRIYELDDAKAEEFIRIYSDDTPKFDKKEIVSSYAIIPCQKIISLDTFNNETYDFLNNGEKVDNYLDNNYQYPTTFYTYNYNLFGKKQENDYIKEDLGIFKFINDLTGKVEYHIGYQVSFMGVKEEIPYIYDIKDNQNYRLPDVGTVEFISIKDYWEEKTITANKAMEILNDYINNPQKNLKK